MIHGAGHWSVVKADSSRFQTVSVLLSMETALLTLAVSLQSDASRAVWELWNRKPLFWLLAWKNNLNLMLANWRSQNDVRTHASMFTRWLSMGTVTRMVTLGETLSNWFLHDVKNKAAESAFLLSNSVPPTHSGAYVFAITLFRMRCIAPFAVLY